MTRRSIARSSRQPSPSDEMPRSVRSSSQSIGKMPRSARSSPKGSSHSIHSAGIPERDYDAYPIDNPETGRNHNIISMDSMHSSQFGATRNGARNRRGPGDSRRTSPTGKRERPGVATQPKQTSERNSSTSTVRSWHEGGSVDAEHSIHSATGSNDFPLPLRQKGRYLSDSNEGPGQQKTSLEYSTIHIPQDPGIGTPPHTPESFPPYQPVDEAEEGTDSVGGLDKARWKGRRRRGGRLKIQEDQIDHKQVTTRYSLEKPKGTILPTITGSVDRKKTSMTSFDVEKPEDGRRKGPGHITTRRTRSSSSTSISFKKGEVIVTEDTSTRKQTKRHRRSD